MFDFDQIAGAVNMEYEVSAISNRVRNMIRLGVCFRFLWLLCLIVLPYYKSEPGFSWIEASKQKTHKKSSFPSSFPSSLSLHFSLPSSLPFSRQSPSPFGGSSSVIPNTGTPPKFFKLLFNWRHLFDNDVIISSGRASSDRYLRWHNRYHTPHHTERCRGIVADEEPCKVRHSRISPMTRTGSHWPHQFSILFLDRTVGPLLTPSIWSMSIMTQFNLDYICRANYNTLATTTAYYY